MMEAVSTEFDDINEFAHDTVIIATSEFTEELLDLTRKEIRVYLV